MNDKKLVKSVSISDAECVSVKRGLAFSKRLTSRIVDIIVDAEAEAVEREEVVWNDMAKLAGYESYEAMELAGLSMKIDWMTRKLEIWQRS